MSPVSTRLRGIEFIIKIFKYQATGSRKEVGKFMERGEIASRLVA
jgi:hypothetical protein